MDFTTPLLLPGAGFFIPRDVDDKKDVVQKKIIDSQPVRTSGEPNEKMLFLCRRNTR
jgi:hypothetical protein